MAVLQLILFSIVVYFNITVIAVDNQDLIYQNFVKYFPFQELIDLNDSNFTDCNALDLESDECRVDCEFFNDIEFLYHTILTIDEISYPIIKNISTAYAMGAGSISWYLIFINFVIIYSINR